MRYLGENKWSTSLLLLAMVFIAVVSFYAISKKEGFFLDEVYTFELSNKQYTNSEEICDVIKKGELKRFADEFWDRDANHIYDYETFEKDLYISDHGAFNYLNVVTTQTMDVHPPLYYFIVHTICSITRSSNLTMIGFLINLVFLLMTCYLVYCISCKLFSNRYNALLPVVYFGFSYAYMNNVTYFRMYCLLSFLITLLALLYLKLQENNWRLDKKILLGICVVEFLAMYTQFFALFFIFPLFAYALYSMRSDMATLKKFVLANVLTGVAFLLFWPQIFLQVMEGSSQKADAVTIPVYRRMVEYGNVLDRTFFDGVKVVMALFIVVLMLFAFRILKRERGNIKQWFFSLSQSKMVLMLFPSLVFYVAVVLFSPWVDSRYISPVYPIFAIGIVTLLWRSLSHWINKEKIVSGITLLIIICLHVGWVKLVPLEHLYPLTAEKESFLKEYGDTDAVIMDHAGMAVFIEVPANYSHPKYMNTDEKNMLKDDFLEKALVNEKYVMYLSDFSHIDSVRPYLNQLDYSCDTIGFKTQFYTTYILKKNSASDL